MSDTLRDANEDDVVRSMEQLGLKLPLELPGQALHVFRQMSGLPGSEEDVLAAMDKAYVSLPMISASDVLEFYNGMLDHLDIEPGED